MALVGDDPAAKSSTRAERLRGARSPTSACRCSTRPTRRTCSTSACTRSRCPGQRPVDRDEDRHRRRRRLRHGVVVRPGPGRRRCSSRRGRRRAVPRTARASRLLGADARRAGARAWTSVRLRAGPPLRGGQRAQPRSSAAPPATGSASSPPGKTYLDAAAGAARRSASTTPSSPGAGSGCCKLGDDPPARAGDRRASSPPGLREIIVVEEKRPFIETAIKDAAVRPAGRPGRARQARPRRRGARSPAPASSTPTLIARRLAPVLAALGDFPSVRAWLDERRPGRARAAPARAAAAAAHAVLLLRLPAQLLHRQGPRGVAGRRAASAATRWCCSWTRSRSATSSGSPRWAARARSGSAWRRSSSTGHLVQNLGDGTFHHSGSLAIRAAVAAGVEHHLQAAATTRRVAMTGGQRRRRGDAACRRSPRCCSPRASRGSSSPPRTRAGTGGVRLPRGVEVWHRDRLVEAQESWPRCPGVTVLIHDQECAAEKRRKRKRGHAPSPPTRVVINERVCEGCGDCGAKSNCLSVQPVETEFGRKTRIHQASCNKDYSCLDGDCPSFLTVIPAGRRHGAGGRAAATRPRDELAEPRRRGADARPGRSPCGSPASAAPASSPSPRSSAPPPLLDGRHVRALDQTGLAPEGRRGRLRHQDQRPRRWSRPNKVAAGGCDLYLVCDLLVGGRPRATSRRPTPAARSRSCPPRRCPPGRWSSTPAARSPTRREITDGIRKAARGEHAVLPRRPGARRGRCSATTSTPTCCCSAPPTRRARCRCPPRRSRRRIGSTAWRCERNLQAFRLRPAARSPTPSAVAAAHRARPPPAAAGPRAGRHRGRRRWSSAPAADGELARLLAHPRARPRRLPGRGVRPRGTPTSSSGCARIEAERVPGRRPRSPRRSPATCTSSWPTRTSTRSPGCRLDPALARRSSARFGDGARVSLPAAPAGAAGARAATARSASAAGSGRCSALLRAHAPAARHPVRPVRLRPRAPRRTRAVAEYRRRRRPAARRPHAGPARHGGRRSPSCPTWSAATSRSSSANVARYRARLAELTAEFEELRAEVRAAE